MSATEAIETFPCFGGEATVIVAGAGPLGEPRAAAAAARARLESWHEQFSRFSPGSELSRLNADPRSSVPASAVMRRLVAAIVDAARASGGLVDGTLVAEIERAGYAGDLEGEPVALARALAAAPARAPAGPRAGARWSEIAIDGGGGVVTRPPGVRFDSGGVAKGLFGDILAEVLGLHDAFAVVCAGDVRVGGAAGIARAIQVESPFDGTILHTVALVDGGAATSGIGRRSWLGADGRPAHHLLDPASGRPAFTGVVQATAFAPTALEAEVRSKTALLAGPGRLAENLPHGGVAVLDGGDVVIH